MSTTACSLIGRARCYFEKKDYEKAIEDTSRIINHFENGNIDKLEDKFMASVYLLRGECLNEANIRSTI